MHNTGVTLLLPQTSFWREMEQGPPSWWSYTPAIPSSCQRREPAGQEQAKERLMVRSSPTTGRADGWHDPGRRDKGLVPGSHLPRALRTAAAEFRTQPPIHTPLCPITESFRKLYSTFPHTRKQQSTRKSSTLCGRHSPGRLCGRAPVRLPGCYPVAPVSWYVPGWHRD